ncbi:MAG: hypothetical protein Q8K75_12585 [Chlamydiales bacterium]|nr:hypothetical protein [Chlamydiales bacterium]
MKTKLLLLTVICLSGMINLSANMLPEGLGYFYERAGTNGATLGACLTEGTTKELGLIGGASKGAFRLKNDMDETCGVLKFAPVDKLFHERLAFVLQSVLEKRLGLTFGVPPTYLIKAVNPRDNNREAMASTLKYIPNTEMWTGFDEREMSKIPVEEFQKFLFHVMMVTYDSHKMNILFQKVKDKNDYYYKVVLVDFSHSLPSQRRDITSALFPWQLYVEATHKLTPKWQKALANMDVESIISEVQTEMRADEAHFGYAISPAEWDLLTISLSVVKYGAQYNSTMRNISTPLMPIKDQSGQEVQYIGGEILDWWEIYYDPVTKTWDVDSVIQQVKIVMKGPSNRILPTTKFGNVERSQPQVKY